MAGVWIINGTLEIRVTSAELYGLQIQRIKEDANGNPVVISNAFRAEADGDVLIEGDLTTRAASEL